VGGTGTLGGVGTGGNNLWQNPQLLGALLPGFNVAAIDQAMQAELTLAELPATELAQQVSQLQSQAAAWQKLQGDLTAILQAAQTLAGTAPYQSLSVTSSDPSSVEATASGSGGPAASYQVTVTQLMQPEVVTSQGYASDTAALGLSGTFSIDGVSVSVSSGDSLQAIAQAINAAAAGATATVLQPAGSGQYVLEIASTTGQSLTWSDPNGILQSLGVLVSSGGTLSPAHLVQAAAPARYAIDGVSLQSPTDQDTTSIPGVTLTFLQPTSAPVTVTTSLDASGLTQDFQSLASAYNTFLSDLAQATGKGGPLEGNAVLLGAAQALAQVLGTVLPGQPAGYQSLPDLGVDLSAPVGSPTDLQLKVDASTLSQAFAQDPSAVASLLTGPGGVAQLLVNTLNLYVGPGGTVPGEVSALQAQIQDLQNQLNDPTSAVNEMVAAEQRRLQEEFNTMLTALLQAQTQGQQLQSFLQAQYGQTSGGPSPSGGTGFGG
jgi:flagellar hook-associated protein 2